MGNKKFTWKTAVSALALAAALAGCGGSAESIPASSVWEVAKNGNSLFLGGSVHLLREQDFPLPAAFDAGFSRSAVLVLEADIDQISDPAVAENLNKLKLLPGGKTLESILDKEVYERLEGEFKKFGVAFAEPYTRYKPGAAVNFLTSLYLRESKFSKPGADVFYLAKAGGGEKETGFLETLEFQIKMLADMGEGYEDEYITSSLNGFAGMEGSLALMVSEWRKGNTAVFNASLLAQKKSNPKYYGAVISGRNAAWMPQIETYLTSEPVEFVIVGVLHLHGPDGLLSQLESKGYTVKPLAE